MIIFIVKVTCLTFSILNLLLLIFVMHTYKNNKDKYEILHQLKSIQNNILLEYKSLEEKLNFSPEKYTDEDIFHIAFNREKMKRFSYEENLLSYRKQEVEKLENLINEYTLYD